jgi:hypothetical protein
LTIGKRTIRRIPRETNVADATATKAIVSLPRLRTRRTTEATAPRVPKIRKSRYNRHAVRESMGHLKGVG